ncbi:MAG: NADPH-dependent FMN reductase [Desulfurococcales archaeon ex4484_58]|nr:MAG: NADPH-dependent FMN reductase [Desulfurococcales archaeon ex4484_58]
MGHTKILIINGSPRKYGFTAKLSAIAEKGVLDGGGEAEKIYLYDYEIKECIGCVSDEPKICRFPCIIEDDDFNKLGNKLLESDGFIIVSPIYWYSVSGKLKNFIDRLTSMENMIVHTGRSLLEGKVAGFIVAGNDSGCIQVISYLMVTMNSMGVHIPPWALAYSHEREDVLRDEQAVRDAYNVGYIVAVAANKLRSIREWYRGDVDLSILREIAIKEVDVSNIQKIQRYKLFNRYLGSKNRLRD